MLKVRNLECGYGTLKVVRGISFHVAAGEVVALVGANGSGKTTLLKAMVGLVAPWAGRVFVGGLEIGAIFGTHIENPILKIFLGDGVLPLGAVCVLWYLGYGLAILTQRP